MSTISSPEIHLSLLSSIMPGVYSLGIPIENDVVKVGTSTLRSRNNISRLLVAGTPELVTIERADSVALQADAFDLNSGISVIFGEPVDKLIIARTGSDSPDTWTPVNEGLVVVSEVGLKEFLFVIQREANYKKVRSEITESS